MADIDVYPVGLLLEAIRRPVELHCAPDVMHALQNGADIGIAVDWSALLYGTPVIVDDDMQLRRWEIREDGEVIGSGEMEPVPWAQVGPELGVDDECE